MARGRGGGLPPRRAGPALHTNQALAGGREGPNPTPSHLCTSPSQATPARSLPNFPEWLRCWQAPRVTPSQPPHHKMYYNV